MARKKTKPLSFNKAIRPELLDELLKDYQSPEDLIGPEGVLPQLTAALISRAMNAEMTHHLGYEPSQPPLKGQTNRRNGASHKTLRTGQGPLTIEVPRDREGSFEPQLIPKHQRHFNGFDDKILVMYARGMSTRDIRETLREMYGVQVSADLISRVTDGVVAELTAWRNRPLDAVYCVVYLDALVVKIRDASGVRNMSVYIALGIGIDGKKEVLGMWIQDTEGAAFWLSILEELKQRGVEDILIVCADGLKGMPQAVEAAFPKTIFQTCVVHVVRDSMRLVPYKERKAFCADLRCIYTAVNLQGAEQALDAFETTWGQSYPMVIKSWRSRWDEITPFLAFPQEIRKTIYTTNAIESLNRQLRKVLKTKGHLPNEQAALKLMYLALQNAQKSKNWGGSTTINWRTRLKQFMIFFPDRIPQ